MTIWISGVCPSSFPCQDSTLIPATSDDPQGTPSPSGLGRSLGFPSLGAGGPENRQESQVVGHSKAVN